MLPIKVAQRPPQVTNCGQTCVGSKRFIVAGKHGATVLAGGDRPAGPGVFLTPTVLADIAPSNPAYRQEFFGPVAMFFRAADENEAIALANDSPFGLGGAICTADPERAKRLVSRLQAGMVFINVPALTTPELPFGGVKRSGFGREISGYGIEEFVNKKMVCIVDPEKVQHTVAQDAGWATAHLGFGLSRTP